MALSKRPRPDSLTPRAPDPGQTVPDSWDDDDDDDVESRDGNAGAGESAHLYSLTPGTHLANISEIMEMIFLDVDPRTLLVSCQRACTLWHRIICSNRQLQERLYFIQPPAIEVKGDHGPGASIPLNPLIQESFAPLFSEFPKLAIDGVKLNSMELPFWDMRNGQRRHKAFTRSNASWRRMHLMPAIAGEGGVRKTNIAFAKMESPDDNSESEATYTTRTWVFEFPPGEGGWRMGELWDLIFAALFMGTETRWKKYKVTPELEVNLGPRGRVTGPAIMAGAGEAFEDLGKAASLWIEKIYSDRSFWGIEDPWERSWRKEAWRYRCEDFDLARWHVNEHMV